LSLLLACQWPGWWCVGWWCLLQGRLPIVSVLDYILHV
jgi:hypothetical protein